MSIERNWKRLFDLLEEIQRKDLYKVAGERLAGCVRDLVLYDDRLDEASGGLAHYTSWENLIKILDVRREETPVLRMYNYESANDPEEGRIRPIEWSELEKEAEAFSEKYGVARDGSERRRGGSTYGCSFSAGGEGVEDHLMFWRLYGNNGKGASLKLGVVSGMQPPKGMYKVRYRDKNGGRKEEEEISEDKAVAGLVKRFLDLGHETIANAPELERESVGRSICRALWQIFDGYCHLVKSSAYEHEQEWRMIKVVRPDSEEVKYSVAQDGVVRRYVERDKMKNVFGSASVITLGPRVPNDYGAAKGYVEALANRHGMKYTRVKASRERYR